MYIGSTRPASARKFQSDMLDNEFLLDWLQRHGQSVDFSGYHCADGAARTGCTWRWPGCSDTTRTGT